MFLTYNVIAQMVDVAFTDDVITACIVERDRFGGGSVMV